MEKCMKLFSNNSITGSRISKYIKDYGGLLDIDEPCIYIPVIHDDNYHYFEDKLNDPERIRTPFVCGATQKDMEYLPNSIFVFVNDGRTNAIATKIGLTNIIGIYTGSISEIEYNANQIIGSLFEGDDFPSSRFKHKLIKINSNGVLTVTSDESLLGYKDERILSHMVSACALRFLVLHEIGHHVKGHISNLGKRKNFVLLKATDKVNSQCEQEADHFAVTKLAEEYELLHSELKKHKKELKITDQKELDLLTLKIIVLGVTLTYSILYQPDNIITTTNDIESTIAYRELYALLMLSGELYINEKCKKAVYRDICRQSSDYTTVIPEIIDVNLVKQKGDIDSSAFYAYLGSYYVNCKRLYYNSNKKTGLNYYFENYLKVLSYIKGE